MVPVLYHPGFPISSHCTLEIVYNLEVDNWGEEERLRLNILDLDPDVSDKSAGWATGIQKVTLCSSNKGTIVI